MFLNQYKVVSNWQYKEDINIYLLNINENFQNIEYSLIPTSQISEIKKYCCEVDQKKRFIARSFLYRYCKYYFQLSDFELQKTEYCQPKFKCSNIQFSFSYSCDYILIGISKNSIIGVDIEYKNIKFEIKDIVHLIMHPEELNYFNNLENFSQQINFFYRIWSGKEALIKAWGMGLYYPVKEINLIDPKQKFNFRSKIYNLAQPEAMHNYLVSFCY